MRNAGDIVIKNLINAGKRKTTRSSSSELLFLCCSNDAMFGWNPFRFLPQRRQLNLVDPIPPRIPLRQLWLVPPVFGCILYNSFSDSSTISFNEPSISRIISTGNTRARYDRNTRSSSY
jgi:hypothetical protein